MSLLRSLFKPLSRFLPIAGLALVLPALTPQKADAALMLDVTSNNGIGFVCGSCTLGYDFTLNSATTIRALGIYDHDANGLNTAHQVGLWDAGGTLLRSTTIDNGSVAIAGGAGSIGNMQWLFENVAEVALGAGTYFVGMTQPTGPQDLTVRGSTSFNLDGTKGIGRIGGFGGGGLTLAFPSGGSNSDGFFGPNLSTSFVGTVPVPGALGMFLLGILGLGWIGTRQRQV